MTTLKNTTIAVTGGCGFIGSHLVRRLQQDAARIVVIDSLEYGRRENLDPDASDVQIEELKLGSSTGDRLRKLFAGVDYVFHLAAEKHNQSINSPDRVLDANVIGTYELLQAAVDSGVKKVVFTSSLYAYGRMSGPPMSEEDVPVPNTIYGISKLSGEHLCRYFQASRGLPAVSLRFFFIYGPRQYAGLGYKSVIVKNFDRMLKGQKPVINGDGKQELDYVYVDDAVSALILAMTADDSFDVFNVGNGVPVNINRLTALMAEIANVKAEPEFAPPDFTHASSRVANIKKFEHRFGPQPHVSLAQGLRNTFEWMVSGQR